MLRFIVHIVVVCLPFLIREMKLSLINIVHVIGNGEATSFWNDTWVGTSPLKNAFPRLFALSGHKMASTAHCWNF